MFLIDRTVYGSTAADYPDNGNGRLPESKVFQLLGPAQPALPARRRYSIRDTRLEADLARAEMV